MKSNEEIVARLNEIKTADFFGFETSDLLVQLPFDLAKLFLKPDAKEENWKQTISTDESIKKEMFDYMEFAWDKANNCRGLSAMRSISHMKAWLFLLGDELYNELDDMYEFYGKPCLKAICEKYDWNWQNWDDGRWRNSEDD